MTAVRKACDNINALGICSVVKVLVLARLVLVGRLVWLLLVLVNLRPHYFSCSPGFRA
jgi:hypothetical protein